MLRINAKIYLVRHLIQLIITPFIASDQVLPKIILQQEIQSVQEHIFDNRDNFSLYSG